MIGILTSYSPTKIILEDIPKWNLRCGLEIFCLASKKPFSVELLRFDCAQNRILKPLRSSFAFQVSQAVVGAAETQTQEIYPTETVHVRFELQKECEFGENFFILGDDPALGLWELDNAVPLNWSDGHVWSVDLELPVGKSIGFKLLLKETTGEILWQPGQNRVVDIWETNKTIIIREDWEKAELQRIYEGEVLVNQEGEESAENVDYDTYDSEKGVEVLEKEAGNIKDESEVSVRSNIRFEQTVEHSKGFLDVSDEKETRVGVVTEEDSQVLVPGMTPMSGLEKEEESDDETEREKKEGGKGREEMERETYVLEEDNMWGYTTLHRLLISFGLL